MTTLAHTPERAVLKLYRWQLVLYLAGAVILVVGAGSLWLRQINKETAARLAALEAGAQPKPTRRAYTAEELGEIYKSNFAAEARDNAWAEAAEREYRGIVESQIEKAGRVVSLECRSKTCRLEVVHENISESNQFLMHLFSMQYEGPLAKAGGGFRSTPPSPTPDDKLDYVVFLGRPGVSEAFPLPAR